MRKIFILLILSFAISFVSAMEITTSVSTGNLAFNKDSTAPSSSFAGTTFPWGLSLYGQKAITDNITLKAGIFYDPVLRYTTNTMFEYSYSFFKLGVGPFFGIFNTPQTIMKSGISTSIRIDIPGIMFASMTADSSMGARFIKTGDYLQEKNIITLGYYIPNALCSFNLISKSFVTKQTAALEVDDSFTEYSFKVDIFKKNVTFKTLLSFAYQQLSRTYLNTTTNVSSKNVLNSLVLGTNFTFQVTKNVSLLANLESNIYSFGYLDDTSITLPTSGVGLYLFRATTGAVIYLDN